MRNAPCIILCLPLHNPIMLGRSAYHRNFCFGCSWGMQPNIQGVYAQTEHLTSCLHPWVLLKRTFIDYRALVPVAVRHLCYRNWILSVRKVCNTETNGPCRSKRDIRSKLPPSIAPPYRTFSYLQMLHLVQDLWIYGWMLTGERECSKCRDCNERQVF